MNNNNNHDNLFSLAESIEVSMRSNGSRSSDNGCTAGKRKRDHRLNFQNRFRSSETGIAQFLNKQDKTLVDHVLGTMDQSKVFYMRNVE